MKNGYKNAMLPPEKRAEILLKEMSLDEKMAQVNGVFPFEELFYDMNAIDAMTPFGIGEVSTLEMRRLEKLEDVAKWQKDVQEIVMKKQSASHSGNFSYGRFMRGLYSGCNKFSVRNRKSIRLGSGIRRTDCTNCE